MLNNFLRYRADSKVTKQQGAAMKKLLGHCKDVTVTYRLASSLGLEDYVKELLSDPLTEARLRDVSCIR